MYYHCRPLKFVEYGKVYPPPEDTLDQEFQNMYRWIEKHCGYYPQVWLSRSHSSITGFRESMWGRRWFKRNRREGILFGFEHIKGFPLNYDTWESIMSYLMTDSSDKYLIKCLDSALKWAIKDDYLNEDPTSKSWLDCGQDLEKFLKKSLFVEVDQVIVPSLNLKAAKKIICRNEKQKKKLLKMGFVEDRVRIKNIKDWK